MSFGLRVLPAADADVDEIATFIALDSIDQAIRFYDAANATYKMIVEAPSRWSLYRFTHPRLNDIRKRAVLGFANHLVFYRIDADMVEIVRVLHGARDLSSIFDASTES